MSIDACVKSVPSNSARADTPHPPTDPDALPQMFFGSDAMSDVTAADASIPYSISRSPAVPELDHDTVGSRPERLSYVPSWTEIYIII